MNKSQAVKRLYSILGTGEFWVHPDCMSEIVDLIARSGTEKSFFNILIKRLKALSDRHEKVIFDEPDSFESVKNAPNIYSMHIESSATNIRILFSFSSQGELLLHTFYERSGKKHTSYEAHLPTARARLKQMLSEQGERK